MLSAAVLFCGFQWNLWRVAGQKWFLEHERAGEAHVVGRLLKSRQDGLFAAAGLTGMASPSYDYLDFDEAAYATQYDMYLRSQPCRAFTPYCSNIGGDGLLFGVLDRLLPLPPVARLDAMHAFCSALTAGAFALIVVWFYGELGLSVAVVVLASAVLAPWLTVFGRNLYWCLWSFYIPIIAAMYFLRAGSSLNGRRVFTWTLVVFAAVAAKCIITGFEYISTVLITPLVPWVYYSLLRKQPLRVFLRGAIAAVAGELLAVGVSLVILGAQISIVQGSTHNAFAHIERAFSKRTYADPKQYPVLQASLSASPQLVLKMYLEGTFFDANRYFEAPNTFVRDYVYRIRYSYLLAVFLLTSAIMAWRHRRRSSAQTRQTGLAMAAACWVSILAPLSWLLIFKSHSYVHTGMNFIVWQMPFTLFGFALVGLALQMRPLRAAEECESPLAEPEEQGD